MQDAPISRVSPAKFCGNFRNNLSVNGDWHLQWGGWMGLPVRNKTHISNGEAHSVLKRIVRDA